MVLFIFDVLLLSHHFVYLSLKVLFLQCQLIKVPQNPLIQFFRFKFGIHTFRKKLSLQLVRTDYYFPEISEITIRSANFQCFAYYFQQIFRIIYFGLIKLRMTFIQQSIFFYFCENSSYFVHNFNIILLISLQILRFLLQIQIKFFFLPQRFFILPEILLQNQEIIFIVLFILLIIHNISILTVFPFLTFSSDLPTP